MANIRIFREMVRLDGIEIFLRDTRTPGTPILCLHGRWGRGETWVDFMRHYGDAFRVMAPDQRGHGLSGKPVSKYTMEEMADDMIALLDRLRIDSVILVGHSMGGGVAGRMAACHPQRVKALAILDKSAAGPEGPVERPLEEIPPVDPETQGWPMPFDCLEDARECIRKSMESELSYQYFMNSLEETVEGYRMMFSPQAIAANIAYYENWFGLLPRIRCPVMLARARGSGAVTDEDFQRMKSLIPRCAAYEMSAPDHGVYLADKQEFYGYFDDFLGRISKEA